MIDLEEGEELRDIEGFPNYWITSFGRVISGPKHTFKTYRVLKPVIHTGDYLQIFLRLKKKTHHKYIHILVAQHFIPNPDNLPTVNHKNGKEKWNNRVDNLEWATQLDNNTHALETGLWNLSNNWGILDTHQKTPYNLRLTINGKLKSCGMYATIEEARIERDRICQDLGLIRPIGVQK